MVNSMTGFAARKGEFGPYVWACDMRSVNARGLDIRLRIPDWIEGLEQALRTQISAELGRGSVSVSLRVQRDESAAPLSLNMDRLDSLLQAVGQIETRALEHDLSLAGTTAADILAMKGLQDVATEPVDSGPLRTAVLADFQLLLADFNNMRASEGAALQKLLSGQLTAIESLVDKAQAVAAARKGKTAQTLRDNLAKVLDNSEGADPDRVAQELALLAVKSDVREELDRLHAHVAAARDLLQASGPVGRKLDFLSQEFNREANTLCSKAQSTELTRVGLDLKALIEQMREQVQNVE